jgi:hypothetical protein
MNYGQPVDPKLIRALVESPGETYYSKVISWPYREDRNQIAVEFFEKIKSGIGKLNLPENSAFCLFNNTWEMGGIEHSHNMVMVLVENHAFYQKYGVSPRMELTVIFQADGAAKGLEARNDLEVFKANIENRLALFFKTCGCPEPGEISSIELTKGLTVGNLVWRLQLPRKEKSSATIGGYPIGRFKETFTILEGPIVCKPVIRQFSAVSVEEAKKLAAHSLESDFEIAGIQDVEMHSVEGEGKSVEAALENARLKLPVGSFDVGTGTVTREASKQLFGLVQVPLKVSVPYKSPAVVHARVNAAFFDESAKNTKNKCLKCGKPTKSSDISECSEGCGWYCFTCSSIKDICPGCGRNFERVN